MKLSNLFNKYLVLFVLGLLTLTSCSEQDATSSTIEDNFISLEERKRVVLEPGATENFEFKVFASAAASTDRTFNILVNVTPTDDDLDDAYFAVPATVTIPANSKEGVFEVSITGTNLGSGKQINLSLESQTGVDLGKSLTIYIKEACAFNLLSLELAFDDYPEETYWEIYDENSNLVEFVEEGDYTGFEEATVDICLPPGNYTFIIFDAFGDGMYDGSNTGTYNLIFLSPYSSVQLASGAGNFGPYETTSFTLE